MNRQQSADWSPIQDRVALSLAAGRSIRAAAREAECGERTVHTWLDDRHYQTYVAELRGRMLDEAVGSLAEATTEAVGTLRRLLDDANSNVRLRAALAILDAAVRMRDHVELGARILRLEQEDQIAGERAGGRPRIVIPNVDDRWTRAQPPQALDD